MNNHNIIKKIQKIYIVIYKKGENKKQKNFKPNCSCLSPRLPHSLLKNPSRSFLLPSPSLDLPPNPNCESPASRPCNLGTIRSRQLSPSAPFAGNVFGCPFSTFTSALPCQVG